MLIPALLQKLNQVQIEPGVHKLPLANYQTSGYKFRSMSGWNGTVGSSHTQKAYMSHMSVIYVHIRYIYVIYVAIYVKYVPIYMSTVRYMWSV